MRTTRESRRRRGLIIAAAAVMLEAASTWLRSHGLGGNLVVRCRQGHLFTTLWIPGVSLKALRFGPWRLQRCPVGHHWALVTPVNKAQLSDAERRQARAQRDVRLP